MLTASALIGSGVALALGATYMAGGMVRTADDQARAARLAEAAIGGYSEATLERDAAAMDPGVLSVARRHDPLTVAGAADRDRQTALFAARLETRHGDAGRLASRFIQASAPAPYRLAGPLENSRELECLTQAVYFEARGETPAGQAAVAQVVLNRTRHAAFPKTVCGVVYQGASLRKGCQFSFACDGSARRAHEAAAWSRAQRVATRALSGAVVAGIGDATHFHTINVAPNWGPNLIRTAQVGLHVFYQFGRGVATTRYAANVRTPAVERDAEPTYATLTSAPAPSAPMQVTADYRLAAVTVEEPKTPPADSAAEAPREPKAPAKPVEGSAKLTPASAPRAQDTAVKAPV